MPTLRRLYYLLGRKFDQFVRLSDILAASLQQTSIWLESLVDIDSNVYTCMSMCAHYSSGQNLPGNPCGDWVRFDPHQPSFHSSFQKRFGQNRIETLFLPWFTAIIIFHFSGLGFSLWPSDYYDLRSPIRVPRKNVVLELSSLGCIHDRRTWRK